MHNGKRQQQQQQQWKEKLNVKCVIFFMANEIESRIFVEWVAARNLKSKTARHGANGCKDKCTVRIFTLTKEAYNLSVDLSSCSTFSLSFSVKQSAHIVLECSCSQLFRPIYIRLKQSPIYRHTHTYTHTQ